MTESAIDPRLPPPLPALPRGTAITVGTFDGVHRGHRAVLDALCAAAAADARASLLVTFEPHPLRVVNPTAAPRLLTPAVEKKEILAQTGLEYAVLLPFTPVLAAYSPERFVDEILMRRLQMRRLVIGYDHGLGRGRSGDVDTLRDIGPRLGFDVDVVPPVLLNGGPISSTRIRKSIEAGDVRAAAAALGRPFTLDGSVVRGEGRGRALGFPTANIQVADTHKLVPRDGIYAVRASLRGLLHDGVLHIGPRPTFAGSPPSIELHLFDFDGDIYGDPVRLLFCERLRDVQPFASVAALVAAIRADCDAARSVLSRGGGGCQGALEELE